MVARTSAVEVRGFPSVISNLKFQIPEAARHPDPDG